MLFRSIMTLLFCLMMPAVVVAEIEVSLYVGPQSAPSSDVDIEGDSVIPDQSFEQDWEG